MRVAPDDDVYRVNAVWLGPRGLTFPWTARYLAYAIWLLVFLTILLIEALTPIDMGIVPVWELSISVFITYALMGFIDHERPLGALLKTLNADLHAPRPETSRLLVRTLPRHRRRDRTPLLRSALVSPIRSDREPPFEEHR